MVPVYQGVPSHNFEKKSTSKKPELTNLQPKTLRNWTSLSAGVHFFGPHSLSLLDLTGALQESTFTNPGLHVRLDLTFKSKKLILAENLQQGGGRFWKALTPLRQNSTPLKQTAEKDRSALPIVR